MAGQESLYKLSDEDVVSLAQGGNKEALDHIIARFRNYVYAKANTYFLVGAECEDVVQEGLIGLYRAIKEYDKSGGSSFAHFAALCISRQIISAVRAATRKKHMPLNSYVSLDDESDLEEATLVVSESENPENIVISQEELESVEYKLNRALSKMEMQVLMYYTEGMSYEEIATALEKPIKSVDNALCRIKKKLIKELK